MRKSELLAALRQLSPIERREIIAHLESSDEVNRESGMLQEAPARYGSPDSTRSPWPKVTLTAVFEPAPEGGYTCRFEEMPEIFSQGETLDEARVNLADALKLVMDYHRDAARSSPTAGTLREALRLVGS